MHTLHQSAVESLMHYLQIKSTEKVLLYLRYSGMAQALAAKCLYNYLAFLQARPPFQSLCPMIPDLQNLVCSSLPVPVLLSRTTPSLGCIYSSCSLMKTYLHSLMALLGKLLIFLFKDRNDQAKNALVSCNQRSLDFWGIGSQRLFYRWGSQILKKLSNFLKVTQLLNNLAGPNI